MIAWWVLLWQVPGSRDWFVPREWDPSPLMGFWLADLLALAAPSLVAAAGLVLVWPGTLRLLWVTAGCWLYALLICLEAALRLPGGWLGTALMATAAGFTLGVAGTLDGGRVSLFRCVDSWRHWLWSAGQTLAQILYCWALVLGAWPLAIVEVQRRVADNVGWLWLPAWLFPAGWTLFAFGGMVGLVSAGYMVRVGRGTPLPTACAGNLVAAGPYRVVRNPMAIGGISQAIGVGLVLGSLPVVAYGLAGALLWHFWIRPMEERDLLMRHGEAYARYRQRVGLWLPRLGRQRESARLSEPPARRA